LVGILGKNSSCTRENWGEFQEWFTEMDEDVDLKNIIGIEID
jgi:hypothetical protein